ncbi:MAG: tetratricopeptide repeat protein [Oceanicaulis sp.]
MRFRHPANAMLRAGAIILASLTLSACTAGPAGFLAPDDEPHSVYGAYLAARYAGAARDVDASARLYADALLFEPGSELISERAFLAALMAGEFERADAAAPAAAGQLGASHLARLYMQAAALAGARLEAPARDSAPDPFSAMVAGMLADWTEVDNRRAREAYDADAAGATPFSVTGHLLVHHALLAEAAREHQAAENAYRAARAGLELDDFTTVLLGAFLERRGRRDEAEALYLDRLAETPGAEDPEVAAGLTRVREGRRAPRFPRADAAAAQALFAPAALLTAQAPVDYSALYLRLIQRLDPEFQRGVMALGEMMESLTLDEAAIRAFESIEDGPFAAEAAVNAAWLQFRTGARAEALDRARALAGETRREAPRLLLADMLRASGECQEAAPLYEAVVERRRAAGEPVDWRPLYYAGVCRQRSAGWREAEPYFLQALEIAPDEPRVLNHLGYNWIVLGEQVEEGFELVSRAADLAPENGAILDSLGWGHFKQGRHREAVTWLERAVERSPADPTINWHLGDAYAATGRDLEAHFQWRRALELDPDPREAALLSRRLELGLDAGPGDLE